MFRSVASRVESVFKPNNSQSAQTSTIDNIIIKELATFLTKDPVHWKQFRNELIKLKVVTNFAANEELYIYVRKNYTSLKSLYIDHLSKKEDESNMKIPTVIDRLSRASSAIASDVVSVGIKLRRSSTSSLIRMRKNARVEKMNKHDYLMNNSNSTYFSEHINSQSRLSFFEFLEHNDNGDEQHQQNIQEFTSDLFTRVQIDLSESDDELYCSGY